MSFDILTRLTIFLDFLVILNYIMLGMEKEIKWEKTPCKPLAGLIYL